MSNTKGGTMLKEWSKPTSNCGDTLQISNEPEHPGKYIREWMELYDVTEETMLSTLNVTSSVFSGILMGLRPLTKYLANRLEKLTGVPSQDWINIEMAYIGSLETRGN
jgi:plasmid maintenance system antidote protein VapI